MSDYDLDHKKLIINDTSSSSVWKNSKFPENKDFSKPSAVLLDNSSRKSITQNNSTLLDNNLVCFKYCESDRVSTASIAENPSVQNISSDVGEISDQKNNQSNLYQVRPSQKADKRDINFDSKNSVLSVSDADMKFDKSIEDYVQDQSHECKQYASELNTKYNKNAQRKGKKGVDFLLKKLESCKKLISLDHHESPLTTSQINGRVTYRFKSMSPDYDKSGSPSSREDDVISPSLSYDDSNDMKQRRKRKLGRPVRLAKEFKFMNVDLTLKDSKSEIVLKSNPDENSYNLFSSCMRQNDSENLKTIESNDKVKDIKECQNKKIDLKVTREKKIESNEIDEKKCGQCEKLSILDMSRYLLDALKNTERTKQRRSSECVFDVCKNNRKMRRRSCDNLKDLLSESATKISFSNQTTAFYEVESQLEKMFAGIIEIDKNVSKTSMAVPGLDKSDEAYSEEKTKRSVHKKLNKTLLSTKNDNNKNKPKTQLKMGTKKKLTGVAHKISNNKCINMKRNSKNQIVYPKLLNKKLLKKKGNMNLNDLAHESTINSNTIKCKGPIIQIKGFQKIPSYIQIINAPKEDDEEKNKEKRKIPSNGIIGRSSKTSFQSNSDYRGKTSNTGLFNSTLSIRYDAHTADITWICVFCKRGPHFLVSEHLSNISKTICDVQNFSENITMTPTILSDLFGPYLIEKNWAEDSTSIDEQKTAILSKEQNINMPCLEYSAVEDQLLSKCKRKETEILDNFNNLYMGMITLGDDDRRWEVWLHEQCIVWAAGVFITGGRICGLQDAVWDAAKSICDTCGLTGANIGCIKRGCKSVVHYCCALTSGWLLDTNHFLPKCNGHDNT